MTDEQVTEAEPVKRKPGRPKGPKRQPRVPKKTLPGREPQRDDSGNALLENFEYTPYEAFDALHIDHDVIDAIKRDYGFSLLWVVHECNGKPFPDLVLARRRNGYAEIQRGNFGGYLDHMCDKDGRIAKEGLVLMGRPVQIEAKAKAYEARQAKAAVENMRKAHAEVGVDVSMPEGGRHPSARSQNRHRQTFEPYHPDKIPD